MIVLRPGRRRSQTPALFLLTPPRGRVISLEGQIEMLSALADRRAAYRAGVALELAGEDGQIRFYARAATAAGAALLETMITTYYPYGLLVPVETAADPAIRRVGEGATARELRLRRRSEVPLRATARVTPGSREEDTTANEVLRVLGALGRTGAGVRALCQLILWPIGPSWGDTLARDLEQARLDEKGGARGEAGPPLVPLLVLAGLALVGDTAYRDVQAHHLVDLARLGITIAGAGGLLGLGHHLCAPEALPPADLMARKLAAPPVTARLRLVVFGGAEEARAETLDRLVAAYGGYGGPRDNSFVARPCAPDPVAQITLAGQPRLWRRPLPVLNADEVARLWRPIGDEADLPGLQRSGARGLLPADYRVTRGLAIGASSAGGKTAPVLLPAHTLRHNTVVIGATGQGKSVWFRHYVTRAIAEEGVQVIVLDPETDLFVDMLGALPERERLRAVALDFNHPTRVPGFNLLDARGIGSGPRDDRTVDQVVSSITLAWERFYSEAWGNRLQDLVEFATETLLRANMTRLRAGLPQYTFLDIKPLLTDSRFRLQALQEAGDIKLDTYWRDDYLGMPPDERAKAIKPVQTRVDTLMRNETAHAIIGQRASTFNIPEIIRGGQHLFINSAAYFIGRSTAAMLDSILLNIINDVVCARPAPRRRVLIVVDEFQHAPARWDEYFTLVRKRDGAYAVAAQGIAVIDRIEKDLSRIVTDNTQTQVVFHSRDYAEAEHRAGLLENVVEPCDIQRLKVRQCYIKTSDDIGPLAVIQADIPLPPPSSRGTARLVIEACARRYGVDRAAVLAERRAWLTQLYVATNRTGVTRRTKRTTRSAPPTRSRTTMLPGSQPAMGTPVTRLAVTDAGISPRTGGQPPGGRVVVIRRPTPPISGEIVVPAPSPSPSPVAETGPRVRATETGPVARATEQVARKTSHLSRREKAERRARAEAQGARPSCARPTTEDAPVQLAFVVPEAGGEEDV